MSGNSSSDHLLCWAPEQCAISGLWMYSSLLLFSFDLLYFSLIPHPITHHPSLSTLLLPPSLCSPLLSYRGWRSASSPYSCEVFMRLLRAFYVCHTWLMTIRHTLVHYLGLSDCLPSVCRSVCLYVPRVYSQRNMLQQLNELKGLQDASRHLSC